MLEGLEISILNLSKVKESIDDFRIHSEFFRKEFLHNEKIINSYQTQPLSKFAKISDGDHAKFPPNQKDEVRYLQARDINNNFLEITSNSFVSFEHLKKNKRSLISSDDILLSIMGTVGDITIVPKDFEPAMCNRALAIIKNIKDISPQFLFAYLTTKSAFIDIERLKNGGVQQRLNLDVLNKLRIPILNNSFQEKVEELVLNSQAVRKLSKSKYSEAEQLLLQEIGLSNFKPSEEGINVKSFKASFGTSGRLDAEYYQPKYEDYLNQVKKYPKGAFKIEDCCNLNGKNYNPISDKEYKYIELSNIGKSGDINGFTLEFGKDLPSRARRLVNENDVLISSIEGSLDSCGLITKEYDKSLCSTGFYVINSDQINSETLLVLFKSPLMQNILKQNCSGTILTAINKDEFLNIYIPIIDLKIQQQIADLVEESFALKQKSEHLLEVAKRAVEIAIEENEEVALEYIEEVG